MRSVCKVKRGSAIRPEKRAHHENGQKEKRYSPRKESATRKVVKRRSAIHLKREPHHEIGQKEKRYSPEKRAAPRKRSKGEALFTRKESRTTKTVKRRSAIHPKKEPHHENGQKEEVYSPE
ncbi:hypothetical protein AZF04_06895 [Alkalihalobacillus trypoxylicola]|uniref:Uncharacterized protein n=1 Tax=Alkalihalobacillus trypoxylicola TaxID=519424 RepID=A0A162DD58_9BACI|nr:hypothetical protein AZF04_06895 [Alkalihalobacillus trypoxylicola]